MNKHRRPLFLITGSVKRRDALAAARIAARTNWPVSGAKVPNEDEQAAILEHEHALREEATRARKAIESLAMDLAAVLRSFPTPRDLHLIVEGAFAAIGERLAQDRLLPECHHALHRAQLDLRQLVARFGLDREAHYCPSPLFHWGLIALLWVAEALVNTGFFALSSSGGLLGGSSIALSLATINVGIGIAAGTLWRWRNVPDTAPQTLATVGAAFLAVAAFTLNGLVAHWRDVASGVAGNTVSVESLLLWGLGVLSAGVAAAKVYSLDDPVPGYGSAHRRLVRAQRAFQKAESSLLEFALDQARSIPSRCRARVADGEEDLKHMGRIRGEALAVLVGFDDRHRDLEAQLQQVVHDWRAMNRKARLTPAPSYFADLPTLPGVELDRSLPSAAQEAIAAATIKLEELVAASASIEEQSKEHIARANALVVAHVNRLVGGAEALAREVGTFELAPITSRTPEETT